MDAERLTAHLRQYCPALHEDFLANQHRYRHYWPEYSIHDFMETLSVVIGRQFEAFVARQKK